MLWCLNRKKWKKNKWIKKVALPNIIYFENVSITRASIVSSFIYSFFFLLVHCWFLLLLTWYESSFSITDLNTWSNTAITASVWSFYPTLSFSSFFLCTNEQILLNIVVWHCAALWSLALHLLPAQSVPLKAATNSLYLLLILQSLLFSSSCTGSKEDGRVT